LSGSCKALLFVSVPSLREMTSTLNLPHGPAFSFCYEISVDQPNDCPHIRRPGTRLAVRCVAGLSVTRSRNMAPPGSVASVAPRVTAPLPPPRGRDPRHGRLPWRGFPVRRRNTDAVATPHIAHVGLSASSMPSALILKRASASRPSGRVEPDNPWQDSRLFSASSCWSH